MGKLVVLKIGEGSFEKGFPVTIQIGDENARPVVEITGELPPSPEIPRNYYNWQSIYRNLKLPSRPIGLPKQLTPTPSLEDCQQVTEELKVSFNTWLSSDGFRPIREKWLEKLIATDNIRVLLQTKDLRLQKLPWHLWDLLERYPHTEIALSAPAYEQVEQVAKTNDKVKILAILGDSQGIDTQADRKLLELLPNADVTFLVEPQSQDLTDQIWEQHWQILFFAGHSATIEGDITGKIYINQTESLTISQLKYALKKAVQRGLQLAIFNSCDGLGLAWEFADLHIPQIIVMREPVPDRVAQQFLKYFLAAFAQGEPLYLAVRQARERLQAIENQFPCATWLPVICQNPAEIPLIWDELAHNLANSHQNIPKAKNCLVFSLMLGLSMAIAGLLTGVRYLGVLQPLELIAFDQLLRSRPQEQPDSRILVVKITEEDVEAQPAAERSGSLSDKSLAKLLDKLTVYQPQVIGLDIYRDNAVNKDYPQLQKWMSQSDRFVNVCRVSDPQTGKSGIAPPKNAPKDGLGFSNTITDTDNVVRRHYLALTPPPASPCQANYSLSVELALRYLYSKGIKLEFTPNGMWQLGKLKFAPLEAHTGGYQGIDALGHQILLNYRSSPSPNAIAPQITLEDAIAGKLNAAAVKGKIVIIGTTAESFHDIWQTPFIFEGNSQEIPGVILQAQMVSQLLSAALDGRSLIWSWPIWGDMAWIWLWSVIGCLLGWYITRVGYLVLTVTIVWVILYGICLIFLILFSAWIPLVPATLALGGGTINIVVFFTPNLGRSK